MSKELQTVYDELSQIFQNLRAEVFVTEIEAKSSVQADDIVTSYQSTFNRSYRRDIIDVKLVSNKKREERLQLNLARNGIYDLLPEGVFHKANQSGNAGTFTSKRKQQKKEEEDARLLFSPIENELFRQRVDIEKKEKSIVREFRNLDDEFLMDFWKIDKSIPKVFAAKLIRLLPYAHQISGDLELTFLSLKKIIDVEVGYKKTFETREVVLETSSENRLGVNFITKQDTLKIQQPVLHVTIQPDKKSEVDQFLGKNGLLDFVTIFYKFFIPMEYHIKTEIEVNKEGEFILDTGVGAYLGMSTRV
ncbi:hypothetical protein Q4566_02935 [Tamlana sp. 2_MG-2023]|uniref:hypothetical protein n=1 Tax=unclassified Tamlana TaxID=2614803 RepID=UPI0026E3E78A|nr:MULTISPECIES: hypothetical protein [unclassified Tamlana]MDO6759142.1 hypothetical protein [Tamlana sp. 2_MG-2023]MDO6789841.1 hypothetical protein [Tamlana sp. 1_MG-2023]